MTLKGALAVAVVILAICLMARGQTTAAPAHHPAVHTTAPVHHRAVPHTPTKKG